MPPRRFTLEEAERLLPRLAGLLTDMRGLKTEHDGYRRRLAELEVKMKGNGHLLEQELKEVRDGMEKTATAISDLIERVQGLGCELKDIDQGLVDFRAEREGREVYLCWKLGEEHIRWWHDVDKGFAGREPLDES